MTEWVATKRKARKPHHCESCWRTIDKGETYERTACFDGGRASAYIECVHCRAFAGLARDEIDPNHEGYDYYSISEMFCSSSDLAIWHGQWADKWRRIDGTLMPIPSFDPVPA
jgi:hypothetical protein